LLRAFRFEKLLNEDPRAKVIYLLGTIDATQLSTQECPETTTSDSRAILKIEKTHFAKAALTHLVDHQLQQADLLSHNDVYHWLTGWLRSVPPPATGSQPSTDPNVKIELVWPCTELHIAKYSSHSRQMVRESPRLYLDRVLPYIRSLPSSRIQWVYNILEGRSEQSKILYREPGDDSGFIVLPDSKWDGSTLENLYLLVLVQRRDILSLRDLDSSHLPLLRQIEQGVVRTVAQHFPQIKPQELRFFVHYHPSYYHFHVHVAHVRYEAAGVFVGQAHLLHTIIDNI
ncbi:scavenger mRNA decapping enzyme, partial [Dimargaris cristalligena]